jgi:hypothetical protein
MPNCVHAPDDPSLAHDDCQGDDRRIHALVIGVSMYHEPAARYGTRLPSMAGPAVAAHRFARYLLAEFQEQTPPGRRLATLRLLLSPIRGEKLTVTTSGNGTLKKTVAGLSFGDAVRKDVSVALQDWADDCHADPRNIAVLYVAGHGVALGRSTSLLFLADAPTERSLALAAVNLSLVETRMADCAAEKNLFFYDCCAVGADTIPRDQSGAMAVGDFQTKPDGRKRTDLICVNAARVGTETFALGVDGTLLSRGLLGAPRSDAGPRTAGEDALLRTAGELVPTVGFGITTGRLRAMLPARLRNLAHANGKPGGYEPTLTVEASPLDHLTGQFGPQVITVPEPAPKFPLTLRGLRTGRTPPVAVDLLDFDGGSTSLAADAADVLVEEVRPGDYTLQVTGADQAPKLQKLVVTGPVDREVP